MNSELTSTIMAMAIAVRTPGRDLRQRRRQHDAPEQTPLGGPARTRRPQQHRFDAARTVEGRDHDRQQAGEGDHRDLREIADAEPDHEQRDQRRLGHRVDQQQDRLHAPAHARARAPSATPSATPTTTATPKPAPARASDATCAGRSRPVRSMLASDAATATNDGISDFGSKPVARGGLPGGEHQQDGQDRTRPSAHLAITSAPDHVRAASTSSLTLRQMCSFRARERGIGLELVAVGDVEVAQQHLLDRARGAHAITTMRVPSATASSTSWVTNSTVLALAPPDAPQFVLQDAARLRIERAERLVHQQDLADCRRASARCATRCCMPPESSRG